MSLLYEDTSYGENGAKAVEEEGRADGICFGMKVKVSAKDDDERLRTVVTQLLEQNNTNGGLSANQRAKESNLMFIKEKYVLLRCMLITQSRNLKPLTSKQ